MIGGRVLSRLAATAIGVWLIAAPAVLGYASETAGDVHRLLGPVAGGAAFIAVWEVVHAVRWVTVPVGVLLVVWPVVGFPAEAAVNSVVSGLAVAALAFAGGPPEGRYGGGWGAVWEDRPRRPAS